MKFYGQFNPPVDQFIYERYFKKKPKTGKGFFIECGAFDGLTESSCKFFEEELGWKGINVEPSPPIFEQLMVNRPSSTNVNAALSNEEMDGIFRSVVHPVYGEMCTSGSLNHTEEHKKLLDEMGCSYKEYHVPIMEWSQLIRRYKVRKCDLFVLDVEGNELKVIDSMRKADKRSLPRIFVVEHGHLDKKEVIAQVESLGYKYDTSSYVNSYFIKDSFSGRLRDWWMKKRNIAKVEDEFFVNAQKLENFREGEEVEYDLSGAVKDEKTFLSIAADKDGEFIIVYSVSGVNGRTSDNQNVYYELVNSDGVKRIFKTCQQVREDYAQVRNSSLYLKSGSRLIIRETVLPAGTYKVRACIEQDNVIYDAGERILLIGEERAEIKEE